MALVLSVSNKHHPLGNISKKMLLYPLYSPLQAVKKGNPTKRNHRKRFKSTVRTWGRKVRDTNG